MTTLVDWRPLAERLATGLEDRGVIADHALRLAFAQTPRHLFVPAFYPTRPADQGGGWQWDRPVDSEHPDWLPTVYSDQPLATQHKPRKNDGGLEISSSSSMPSLMADMLGELDLEPGTSILEVGTGTGYNAAILCHLLGDEHVTTIDIDPDLTRSARERLARLGHCPSTTPQNDTYDRVLATHSAQRIPHEWVRWARPGAVILTDLRDPHQRSHGVWAKLTVNADSISATGRLTPSRGGFMGARTSAAFVEPGPTGAEVNWDQLRKRTTELPRTALDNDDFAFFLWWHIPGLEWFGFDNHTNVNAPGGRYADIQDSGTVFYTLFGDIWASIEQAHHAWHHAGRPGIDDWTILVTEDGRTTLAQTEDLEQQNQ